MTLRVAVLGAGYFARFHHEAWQRLPGVDLAGIADLEVVRAEEAAETHSARAFPDLSALIDGTQPDVIDIAVPPPAHAAAIRLALAARPRVIVCQKPFAQALTEAEALTAEAEAAGIPLVVHENFRFQPWFRAMRTSILRGDIGGPQNVTFRLRTGDGQGPRAYLDRQPYFQTMPRLFLHETGVHYFDTFRYLMGADPTHLYADIRRLNPVIAGEDAAHVLVGFPDNARAVLDGNRLLDHATPSGRRTFGEALVEGPNGALSLDGFGAVTLRPFGQTDAHVLLPAQDYGGFAGDCVHALQAHVVAHLTEGEPLENEARNYLTVRRMEEAAYRSARDGVKVSLR